MTNRIPDARTHLVRYYRAYANRSRRRDRGEDGEVEVEASRAEGSAGRASRASWARLLRRVLEIDLVCPRCHGQMVVISFLTDPEVVDRVLRHVREGEVELLFDVRAPPAA